MSIQWGRVVLAAFLMEVVLIAIAVPLFMSGSGDVLVYVIPPAALVATFIITMWIGRGIHSKFVLHGVLIGIVGTLMYVALTRAKPEPWQYWAAHALKIIGGAAAGVVVDRRQITGNKLPSAA
jgi:hypothetical protein